MEMQDQQSWIEALSQSEAEQCLANLHSLADQLRGAMEAIVQRSLPSLQHILHLQDVSCSHLADLRFVSTQRRGRSSETENTFVDSHLASQIRAAIQAVQVLNRSYAGLLKHSGDTLLLLAGLYRSYRGCAPPLSENYKSNPTWSCEV